MQGCPRWVQWLRLRAFIAERLSLQRPGFYPWLGTKISHKPAFSEAKKKKKTCMVTCLPLQPSLHLRHLLLCPGIPSCMGTATSCLVLWLRLESANGEPQERRRTEEEHLCSSRWTLSFNSRLGTLPLYLKPRMITALAAVTSLDATLHPYGWPVACSHICIK